MRWFDEYLGLLAVASVYGAAVLWVTGAPLPAQIGFLGLACAGLSIMLWRVRHTPRVLLVGEPAGRPHHRLRQSLDDAGYGLRFCPGPGQRPCPVLEGKPCPVRGHPAAALILRRRGDTSSLPPCGEALGVQAISLERDQRASGVPT